jgi:hypothetical protein
LYGERVVAKIFKDPVDVKKSRETKKRALKALFLIFGPFVVLCILYILIAVKFGIVVFAICLPALFWVRVGFFGRSAKAGN